MMFAEKYSDGQAALRWWIFETIRNTQHSDTVNTATVRQIAKDVADMLETMGLVVEYEEEEEPAHVDAKEPGGE